MGLSIKLKGIFFLNVYKVNRVRKKVYTHTHTHTHIYTYTHIHMSYYPYTWFLDLSTVI